MTLRDQFLAFLIVRAASLLRADLHDASVLLRDLGQPAAFPHEHAQRLFDIHVLAGGARHHRHQAVPMIGRGDDDGLHVLVVEQLAEVGIAFALPPHAAIPCSMRGWYVSLIATMSTSF